MLNRSLILVVVLFFVSCSVKKQEQVEVPSDLLQEDSMVALLVDINIMEASMNLMMVENRTDSTRQDTAVWEDILQKHRLTAQQYEKNIAFYAQHPELLDKVYGEVLNELSKKQAEPLKK